MKIIAYTYEADLYCVDCAVKRFGINPVAETITRNPGYGSLHTFSDGTTEELDENLIPLKSSDGEGNKLHPVFSTDEQEQTPYCGDCFEKIG